jgi:quercetin dioxygenase-like cupin family protein
VSHSRVIRHDGEGWASIAARRYKDDGEHHAGVVRHTLLPASAADALGFETRYFEVAAGGYSSLEQHAHPHVVIVLRGRGSVRLGERTEPIAPRDVVFVAPWEPHRFSADRGEPLGFVCIVDGERDLPQVVEETAAPR